MKHHRDTVQDSAGNVVDQATVSITLTDGTPAVIYADAAGSLPYPSNVVLTNDKGTFEFYTADGRYNISVTKAGVTTTLLDVEIVDAFLFASRITTVEGFAHFLSPVANQTTVVPDVNGDLSVGAAQDIAPLSDPTFRDLTVRKLRGDVAHPPTLVAWGTGVGASAVPTSIPAGFGATGIDGTDLFVKVGFTTSAAPAASQPICTIAWGGGNGEFATAPDCPVVALGRNAMGVVGSAAAGPLATGGPNGIVLTSGPTPLAALTTYQFGIIVHGK